MRVYHKPSNISPDPVLKARLCLTLGLSLTHCFIVTVFLHTGICSLKTVETMINLNTRLTHGRLVTHEKRNITI